MVWSWSRQAMSPAVRRGVVVGGQVLGLEGVPGDRLAGVDAG